MVNEIIYGIGGAYLGATLYMFNVRNKNGWVRLHDLNISLFYYAISGSFSMIIIYKYFQ
jgi:uncharacterized membrane protein YeaQ/YmgE (transglycosylase-associated protein family)